MGYTPCKMVSLAQKLKMPKRCEKRLYDHIKVVVCKNRSKKHLIFEKWQHFENGQNWPRCMGYSPCKMFSLGQKLKMAKRCEKRLYDHIKVFVCKKPLQKTPNIRKMTGFWKWPKFTTMNAIYIPCKMGSSGQKLKMPKRCEKGLYDHIKVVACKKPLQKAPNIRKMTAFWKWPKLATMHGL